MDGAIEGARRRGRPAGRTAAGEAQRRRTRAAILAGAGEVFAAAPYVHATIDDIIRAAGVSRATFYTHFESKLALAIAIYDGIAGDWLALFDALADARTAGGLRAWLDRLAALYADHGYVTPLVAQLRLFEPSFRERLLRDRDRIIDRLARAGLAGFAAAEGDMRERARAHLLLRRLDEVCADLATGEALAGIHAELMVEELEAFIAGRA
ncbi:TetR/AcrR family transcriptional regulator [Edaphosphingomonas haloaromaticamans]|uniref:Bacterial regulatory protein, tetR family n=1 Tax=Edaphosphingomonas haloaromaticamans TaxID=653954 RepID=A0A1S1HEZ0_9SPHN|nr:TetR/AcrR family transcriptional regulator [Sphingomonas haloaromaticamans]OHT20658.1 Bacterial regulatory protein, tetR family [Sphingomonas haloaromaticamans]